MGSPLHKCANSAPLSVTLQSLETLEGNPRGARHKLQQPGPSLLIKGFHRLPEPLDNIAVSHAVLQACVGLPVIQVDLIQATYYELMDQKYTM